MRAMTFKHTGLTCRSEENADRFYQQILGLERQEPKILAAALSQALFGIEAEVPIINYVGSAAHFEIFIYDSPEPKPSIDHTCLQVESLPDFLDLCRQNNVEIQMVPKGNKTITFVKDFDGNSFEIV